MNTTVIDAERLNEELHDIGVCFRELNERFDSVDERLNKVDGQLTLILGLLQPFITELKKSRTQ